jgi:hypothetical protein
MIHWEDTIDDGLAFYKYYVETDAEVRRNIRLKQFIAPLAVCFIFAVRFEDLNLLLIMAALSLVWIALAPAWVRGNMVANARKEYLKPENFRNLGAREMTVSSEGFLLKTAMRATLYKWETVAKVIRVPDYCFIDIAGQEILVVPEGRLTKEEFTELNGALEKYVKN